MKKNEKLKLENTMFLAQNHHTSLDFYYYILSTSKLNKHIIQCKMFLEEIYENM